MIKNKKLVTHNGSFHADDVFACATLCLMLEKKGEEFEIFRTRRFEEIVEAGDYVFDLGGIYDEEKNRFDHHQKSFNVKRKNGIIYSSFGLVWKKFGKEICNGQETKDYIDTMLVEQVDANDNGMNIFKPLTTHIFNYQISSVIASFRPNWGEKDSPKFFKNAVDFAKFILKREIDQFNSFLKARKIINQEYKKSKNKKLLILNMDIPRYLVNNITVEYKKLLFLVFLDQENWKVITVPKKLGAFGNKKDLPKAWAGLTGQELQKITGVKDATFCHKRLYMAVAKSKEGAIKLAQIAVES
jgi:uncharacterized UPF0160 family protein